MPKINITKQNNIESEEGASFLEHSVPSAEDVKEEEIEESLMEIYQDENGNKVDVSKLYIKKKRGLLYYLLMFFVFVSVIAGGVWAAYKYMYLPNYNSADSVDLSISAPREIISGKEFVYSISYKNLNNISIKNIEIKLNLPSDFVFLDANPTPAEKNNIWRISDLGPHRSGKIEMKGKIISQKDSLSSISASMAYVPENISTEFRKDASFETIVSGTGLDISFDYPSSVLAGDENEVAVKFKQNNENYLNNFRMTANGSENFEISAATSSDIEFARPNAWLIKKITDSDQELVVKFKFKEKLSANEDVVLTFENSENGSDYYKFLEKKISFEILKNDLNLNLILNGARHDQGINFGDVLNYSIVFSNKGEAEMKDIVIMAVLDSDIIDWPALTDGNKGKVMGNTISWSKDEIPLLASLVKDAEGTIDFSLKILPMEKIRPAGSSLDSSKKYDVKSYSQFSIGNRSIREGDDTKSNVIISKLNSDLDLEEQVRYFNSDNIAVGSGPLPPTVGETTSFKVYWIITNNLHELNNLKAEVILPEYVQWSDKGRTTAGSIQYDSASRKVIWDVGRLPMDVYKIDAEFSISITPVEADKDKIIVLLPGSSVSSIDSATNAEINKTTKAKTTKLEDDDIANSDGRVVGR